MSSILSDSLKMERASVTDHTCLRTRIKRRVGWCDRNEIPRIPSRPFTTVENEHSRLPVTVCCPYHCQWGTVPSFTGSNRSDGMKEMSPRVPGYYLDQRCRRRSKTESVEIEKSRESPKPRILEKKLLQREKNRDFRDENREILENREAGLHLWH